MTLPGSSQCKIWFWVVWQLVLIASCYTYCCSEPSLHSHLMQKIKYVLKEMLFGDNAMTKHHLLPSFGATWRTEWSRILFEPKDGICLIQYLRKQSVSVVVPETWLSPFTTLPSLPGLSGQKGVEEPGKSKLMSQNGSIVVETPLWKSKQLSTCFKEIKLTVSLISGYTPDTLRTMGSTSPLEGTQRWQKI